MFYRLKYNTFVKNLTCSFSSWWVAPPLFRPAWDCARLGFGLSVCVLGCAGRRRGGFAGLSWSGSVSVAPVEGAFRWHSGGDPQLVVVQIRVAGDDRGGLFAMFLRS